MTVFPSSLRIAGWRAPASSTLSQEAIGPKEKCMKPITIRPKSLALAVVGIAILLFSGLSSAQTYTALYTFPETSCNTTGIGAPEVIA